MTDEKKDQETVSVVSASRTGALWRPSAGRTCANLEKRLVGPELPDHESFERIKESALSVLAQAEPPNGERARRTGIVVGQVQSGKTMSMTTVAALARDNGFRIVVVLAGVTTNLLRQSKDRFQKYLQPEGQMPLWRIFDSESRSFGAGQRHELEGLLSMWRAEDMPEKRKPALLLTVMKHHRHLHHLAELFSDADLTGVPAIIVDDEADQAGLNTLAGTGQDSTTHQSIARVRRALPHHTYLQYTATPQAPLLISLVDMLSPEFVEVLAPGDGYTGGETFFGDGARELAQRVEPEDIFVPGSPPADPPVGFHRALMQFLVAAASFCAEDRVGPWSMLVHPSQRKSDHDRYFSWAQTAQKAWSEVLALDPSDPDRGELEEQLREAYDELAKTDGGLPDFDDVLQEVRFLISQVVVTRVNSEDGDEIPWSNSIAHILVGGEKLNRGYTVKGLTITYMPRGAGGWNADTIQQRARFFGYKASYIDRCRVYLHPDVHRAYRDYVAHESNIRQQLIDWHGKPLKDWKRAFFMEGALRPTRGNVLTDGFHRIKPRSWRLQVEPHDEAIRSENNAVTEAFLDSLELQPGFWTSSESGQERHRSAVVPLDRLLEDLLVPFGVVGEHDVKWMYALRVMLRDGVLQKDPEAETRLVVMEIPGDPSQRRRRTAEDGRVVKIHQGRDKAGHGDYPGDSKMRDDERVTVQIHPLDVETDGERLDAFALAVFVPMDIDTVIVQPGA